MRRASGIACLFLAPILFAAEPLIQDRSHPSEVLREERNFRIFLPPDYGDSAKRYPVIYWFHGWGERYNRPGEAGNYDEGEAYNGDTIAAYVSTHDVIVVKPDGFNPRHENDDRYPRPYNVSPVETHRQFALYFPELAGYIDASYRTIPDRNHRAVTGFSMGGFMSLWLGGKYPDLVSSASAFMPSTEFFAGYRGQDVEYRHEEMWPNFAGVRTLIVAGTHDFIRFYHRRLQSVWKPLLPQHEMVTYESKHGTPGIAAVFDFHLSVFANPQPPPELFSHIDVYPNFSVWGWEAASDRRRAGFTVLENVSKTGFRSSVRDWMPSGKTQPEVKLTVITGRLYAPGIAHPVTVVRVRDGRASRTSVTADAEGRLSIELDGDVNEVGIGAGGNLALANVIVDEAVPLARKPFKVRAVFVNKGITALPAASMKWSAPPGVVAAPAEFRLPALAPGARSEVAVTLTSYDESRERVVLASGPYRLDVAVFPSVQPRKEYRFVDGTTLPVVQHGDQPSELTLGAGNGDGRPNAGESFAVAVPDAGAWRALELFSSDPCLDVSQRQSDLWGNYDHVGASAKYSIASISQSCPPGKIVRFAGRLQIPDTAPGHADHRIETYFLELTVGPARRQ